MTERNGGHAGTEPRPNRLSVEHFGLDRYDGADVVFRHGDHRAHNDDASILIRLNVDGGFDLVEADFGQTGDLRALCRAIDALSAARDQLARFYGDRPRHVGRCLEHGDWGRCKGADGHEGAHDFPTQEDHETDERILAWASTQGASRKG